MKDQIKYRAGYKYQLVEDYSFQLPFFPGKEIVTPFIEVSKLGVMKIKAGYAWDGPSGPTIDTKNFMRGSLVHDALYQLMREDLLDHDRYRINADGILERICREDGMSTIRCWWVYTGVRWGAGPAADPKNDKPIISAP